MPKKPQLVNHEIQQVQKNLKVFQARGHRYKVKVRHILEEHDAHGLCDHPKVKNKEIIIDPDQQGRRLLGTVIDELIHQNIFELDNDTVREMSDSISKQLWKVGYRIPKK